MALRPTELQIIIAATRDIEKVQQIQQHSPRALQEQLAVQFQHQMEEKRRQTQSLAKAEENNIRKIDSQARQGQNQAKPRREGQSQEQDKESTEDGHIIDFLA